MVDAEGEDEVTSAPPATPVAAGEHPEPEWPTPEGAEPASGTAAALVAAPAPTDLSGSASEIIEEELEVATESDGDEDLPGMAQVKAPPEAAPSGTDTPATQAPLSLHPSDMLAAMPSEVHAAPESASDELFTANVEGGSFSEDGTVTKGSFEAELEVMMQQHRDVLAGGQQPQATAVAPHADGTEPQEVVASTSRVELEAHAAPEASVTAGPPPLSKEQSERSNVVAEGDAAKEEVDEYSMSFDGDIEFDDIDEDIEIDAGPVSGAPSPTPGSHASGAHGDPQLVLAA